MVWFVALTAWAAALPDVADPEIRWRVGVLPPVHSVSWLGRSVLVVTGTEAMAVAIGTGEVQWVTPLANAPITVLPDCAVGALGFSDSGGQLKRVDERGVSVPLAPTHAESGDCVDGGLRLTVVDGVEIRLLDEGLSRWLERASGPAAAETVEPDPVGSEPAETETAEARLVEAETVEAETVEAETVEAGPLEAGPLEVGPLEPEPAGPHLVETRVDGVTALRTLRVIDTQTGDCRATTALIELGPLGETPPADPSSIEPSSIAVELDLRWLESADDWRFHDGWTTTRRASEWTIDARTRHLPRVVSARPLAASEQSQGQVDAVLSCAGPPSSWDGHILLHDGWVTRRLEGVISALPSAGPDGCLIEVFLGRQSQGRWTGIGHTARAPLTITAVEPEVVTPGELLPSEIRAERVDISGLESRHTFTGGVQIEPLGDVLRVTGHDGQQVDLPAGGLELVEPALPDGRPDREHHERWLLVGEPAAIGRGPWAVLWRGLECPVEGAAL